MLARSHHATTSRVRWMHVSGQWLGCASLRGFTVLPALLMRIRPFTMGPRGNEVPSEGVTEFGGWPQPPRWVWAVTAVAAGALLVEEAGGRVTDDGGGALQGRASAFVASNGGLHEAFVRFLNER